MPTATPPSRFAAEANPAQRISDMTLDGLSEHFRRVYGTFESRFAMAQR